MSQPEVNSAAEPTVSLPEAWQAELARRAAAAPSPVAERIAVIDDSLRCFAYGWFSCLPVVGAAYLYSVVRRFMQARRRNVEWNPARGYLATGLALGSVGWLVMLLSWLLLLSAVQDALSGSDTSVLHLLPVVVFFGCPPGIALLMLAGLTLFPSLELKRRSEQFARELSKLRIWLVLFGSAWLLWSFGISPLISWGDAQMYRPVISWTLWLLGGMGCLPLVRLLKAGARTAWVTFAFWLVGLALLTQKLVAE